MAWALGRRRGRLGRRHLGRRRRLHLGVVDVAGRGPRCVSLSGGRRQARPLGRQLGEPRLDQLGQLGQLRRLGALPVAAGHRHHHPPLADQEHQAADLARLGAERGVAHLVGPARAGERGHELVVLDLGGGRAEPPDAQADVEALGLAERLEVAAVVELGRRQIGQLAVLELADVAGDGLDLVVAEQLGDIERRECRGGGRRLGGAVGGDRQALPSSLERGRLQLPGGRQPDLGTAAQEDQVGRVPVDGLPAIEPHAVAALAEIAADGLTGEHAVAAPADVTAVVDDQRETPDARRRPLGQIVEAGNGVAAVGAGLHDQLARARRRMEANAVFEPPRRGDGGPRDRPVRIGVEHEAVVGAEEIGGTDGVGADRERRLLDQRSAGRCRDGGRCRDDEGQPQRQFHRRGARCGAIPPRIDRSGGSCYLLTHLGNRGAAPAGVGSGPPVTKGFGPLQTPST